MKRNPTPNKLVLDSEVRITSQSQKPEDKDSAIMIVEEFKFEDHPNNYMSNHDPLHPFIDGNPLDSFHPTPLETEKHFEIIKMKALEEQRVQS